MGFDPNGLHSSLFWASRTSAPRNNLLKSQKNSAVATLNRNFGSTAGFGANRLAISNLKSVFDHPNTTASTSSHAIATAPFNRFGTALGHQRSGHRPLDPYAKHAASSTNYTFGQKNHNNTAYNTVNTRHPPSFMKPRAAMTIMYDTSNANNANGEEYEDLDYYERPPTESPAFVRSAEFLPSDASKSRTRRNTLSSSPQYHISSTTTTATTKSGMHENNSAEHNVNSEHNAVSSVPLTPPPFPNTNCPVASMRKNSAVNNIPNAKKKFFSEMDGETQDKNFLRSYFCGKRRIVCVVVLFVITAILFALGSVTLGYVLYLQRQENGVSSSLSDFLRDSSLLFQQKKHYQWDRILYNNNNNTFAVSDDSVLGKSVIGNNNNNLDSFEGSQSFSGLSPKWETFGTSLEPSEFTDYGTTTFSENSDLQPEERSRFAHNNAKPALSPNKNSLSVFELDASNHINDDVLIEPKHLLTLQITQRKICLFEVSTSEQEQSRHDFRLGHIPGARLLFYSSLSHNGVPVHPLQFQRYARSLGVNEDCKVVLYDRGQQIWAAYAFWIFELYGQSRISLLSGGFEAWRRLSSESSIKKATNRTASADPDVANPDGAVIYRIEGGSGSFTDKPGNFRAKWNSEIISTFDDVLSTFEAHNGGTINNNAEIIDAQTVEEFNGKMSGPIEIRSGSVIYGHIRGAINIPCERLYDSSHTWNTAHKMTELFRDEKALVDTKRPLIVYDGTSLRATMVWLALKRQGYANVSVYFGSWPEWVIRAPDYLKVIPEVT